LEVVVGGERERVLLFVERDVGCRALEVVTLGDLLARLIQGVVHFLEIDRGGDVERHSSGHGTILGGRSRNDNSRTHHGGRGGQELMNLELRIWNLELTL